VSRVGVRPEYRRLICRCRGSRTAKHGRAARSRGVPGEGLRNDAPSATIHAAPQRRIGAVHMTTKPRSPAEVPSAWLARLLRRSHEHAVIRVDLHGVIVGWHGAATRLFGYRRQEICGHPFAVLFTPEDRAMGLSDVELDVARRASRSEDDRWHVRKGGGRFWGSGVVNKLYGPDGTAIGFVKIVRDRTDVRIRYVTLQNRLETAHRELAKQREDVVTLVHELRNPLSPLLGAAQIFRSNAASAQVLNGMADIVERQVALMKRLLDDAAAGPSARRRGELRSVALSDALRAVVGGLQADAVRKGLTLELVVPPVSLSVDIDSDHLHQMVLNLVLNAVKYTPAGGRVVVSASVEGELLAIRVDDDGIGIDPDNLSRIFDLFVRESGSEAEGLGVGLAVVKRLAADHGGFVEARSPGRGLGSQFTLQLPLRRAGPATG